MKRAQKGGALGPMMLSTVTRTTVYKACRKTRVMELDFCRVEVVSAQAYCQRGSLHAHKTETHLHRESRESGWAAGGMEISFLRGDCKDCVYANR